MAETWADYVRRTTGNGLQKDTADAAGIDPSTISRWIQGKFKEAPAADKVVALARAVGRPPKEALVAAGYLTEEEAGEAIEVRPSPADLTDDDLARELLMRLDGVRRADNVKRSRHGWGRWQAPDAVTRAGQDGDNDKKLLRL